jgi:hypothetical protein
VGDDCEKHKTETPRRGLQRLSRQGDDSVYRCIQKDKSTLNPIKFVEEAISKEPSMLDEVALRRFISALYFSLFNYWAEKKLH